jgi:hypothetical protein
MSLGKSIGYIKALHAPFNDIQDTSPLVTENIGMNLDSTSYPFLDSPYVSPAQSIRSIGSPSASLDHLNVSFTPSPVAPVAIEDQILSRLGHLMSKCSTVGFVILPSNTPSIEIIADRVSKPTIYYLTRTKTFIILDMFQLCIIQDNMNTTSIPDELTRLSQDINLLVHPFYTQNYQCITQHNTVFVHNVHAPDQMVFFAQVLCRLFSDATYVIETDSIKYEFDCKFDPHMFTDTDNAALSIDAHNLDYLSDALSINKDDLIKSCSNPEMSMYLQNSQTQP